HQWKAGRDLYDVIADGVAAREQPLIVITTTAGTIRGDIYDEKYEEFTRIIEGYENGKYTDDRVLPILYELDSRNEWSDPACWKKANPGLGTIKNLATLAEKVERCKENPRLLKNVLCKEFNIPETTSESWLTFEEIRNRETFRIPDKHAENWIGPEDAETILRPRYAIGGVDLSSTTDLTAAKIIFQVPESDKIFVHSMYWLPEDNLERRVKEDKIPYDFWHERGLVRLSRGNKIDPHDVTLWFRELWEQYDIFLYAIGYDEWGAEMWASEMRQTFGADTMIPVRQGVKTLSAPMKALGADLASHRIVYNDNPVDEWCLANTTYEEDKNGNIQPKKTNNPRRRIDGAAALLDAYTVLSQKEDEYKNII
ncbi:MAG: terminase large subunit, partial [Lachnospiraceae bacterium]|nr:terminase large subunit [Lachnospiraceae bacterium]